MAFTVPNFNLPVNLWRAPAVVIDPPTLTFFANLSRGERVFTTPVFADGTNELLAQMILLCPALTDIRPSDTAVYRDLVEVPAGSGRYYAVVAVDDTAKGFLNEYRFAVLFQFVNSISVSTGNPWAAPGVPYPMP